MSFDQTLIITPAVETKNRHLVAPFHNRSNSLCREQVNIFWHELLLSLKCEYISRASPAFPRISLSVPSGLCRRSEWAPVRACGQDSPQAYGSAVYLQCAYRDATISSWLVAFNCKVAPLKPMTKPWLELAGAVLALRLTQNLTLVLGLLMQAIIPTAWMYCGGA